LINTYMTKLGFQLLRTEDIALRYKTKSAYRIIMWEVSLYLRYLPSMICLTYASEPLHSDYIRSNPVVLINAPIVLS